MNTISRLQFPLFTPPSEWVPPDPLPDLTGAKEIAVDLETRDPDLKTQGPGWPTGNGEVVGIAVAVEGWMGYLPIAHLGGGNLDRRIVTNWLKKQLATDCPKIMHNAQYDAGWLRQMGITMNGPTIDTMIMGSLLDENRFSFSLNALAFDYLGEAKSERTLTEAAIDFGVDPKAELWKLPAQFVGSYAEQDAKLALDLYKFFKVRLAAEDLSTVFDLESRLTPCLIDMTWRGIRVDMDRAERTKQELLKREKETLKSIKSLSGFNVEIWAAASLAKAFDTLGLQYPKTTKGAPSFTKAFLSEHPHDFPKLVVKARELNKVQGTFITSIMKHVGPDGRIHGHVNQIRSDDGGTVSGRISMNNPNLQQIPARDPELGPMIRSLFLPEEGEQWAAIDFSQQEPRILVHYASVFGEWKRTTLRGVDEFLDGYRNDPDMDFHTMVSEMANIPRKQAKTINLGMMYGMGVNKLAAQLDIEPEEAKELTKQYHSRVPFVKELMNGVSLKVESSSGDGAIRSLKGRKCRFELWEPRGFELRKALPRQEAEAQYGSTASLKRAYTYKALNRLIQASAADMTKQAMVDMYESGETPLVQVHDELGCSVQDKNHAIKIKELMENAIALRVPNKCDIDLGPSWGEAEEVK
jgi:DNA polymerase I-like protein with 3'-5' exonuclease and polymerase domains